MQMFENTLVVIPARGGSKRIPNKNIKSICGQPMIYWPLMELRKIFKAENVLVSTDSNLIKVTVEQKGQKVPFIRPKSLSDDFTGTVPVANHALSWYEQNVKEVDYVLTVYPTALLLREEDIYSAMATLRDDKSCDSVMSASNFPFQYSAPFLKIVMDMQKCFSHHTTQQDHRSRRGINMTRVNFILAEPLH